jgi:hypothetical protein
LLGDASSRTETVVLPAIVCSYGREAMEKIRRQREVDVWIIEDHVIELFLVHLVPQIQFLLLLEGLKGL